MTYYDMIKICKNLIDRQNLAGFRPDDCKHLALYEDYPCRLVRRLRLVITHSQVPEAAFHCSI